MICLVSFDRLNPIFRPDDLGERRGAHLRAPAGPRVAARGERLDLAGLAHAPPRNFGARPHRLRRPQGRGLRHESITLVHLFFKKDIIM